MVDFQYKDSYGVKDLEEIVRILRAPGGCPWDAEQTHQSIRRNFLEEAYEAVEAIDEGSPEHLEEELGDVLLQVVMHARMEQEAGRFDLDGVADGICKKLIYRHPHVFGDVAVSGTGEVLSNWEALKRKEKGQATNTDALEAVARALPALWRAEKVQKKARKAGFDWPDVSGALDKLSEELEELKTAAAEGTTWPRSWATCSSPPSTPPASSRWIRRTPSTGPPTSSSAASGRWRPRPPPRGKPWRT